MCYKLSCGLGAHLAQPYSFVVCYQLFELILTQPLMKVEAEQPGVAFLISAAPRASLKLVHLGIIEVIGTHGFQAM